MRILVMAPRQGSYHALAEVCGGELVYRHEDADVVMFTGGADINPALYDEQPSLQTGTPDINRDMREKAIFNYCLVSGIPMVGICRGAQLLCALSGGKLEQHVSDHGRPHAVTLNKDDSQVQVTSTHHQMMIVSGVRHKMLAHATHRGSVDPEVVWFPDTKSLAVQYHPEYMPKDSEGYMLFIKLFKEYMNVQ